MKPRQLLQELNRPELPFQALKTVTRVFCDRSVIYRGQGSRVEAERGMDDSGRYTIAFTRRDSIGVVTQGRASYKQDRIRRERKARSECG